MVNHDYPSEISFGSEFKHVSELETLLGKHPRWIQLKDLLVNGADFPTSNMDDSLRKRDLEAALKRGNHKSAKRKEKVLSDAMVKEVEKGWMLLIPDSKLLETPKIILNPMGVATHIGIDESGRFTPKDRVTHDLSFPGLSSGESVNSRTIEDNLEPIMFGFTLIRIIHYIVHLRAKFPGKII